MSKKESKKPQIPIITSSTILSISRQIQNIISTELYSYAGRLHYLLIIQAAPRDKKSSKLVFSPLGLHYLLIT
jgi:hypothetical protein